MTELRQPMWHVGADTLGLANSLKEVRNDVTFPGDDGMRSHHKWQHPPCVVTDTGTPDEKWIPLVTRAGLAVIASNARMFAITSNENLDRWGLLEVVVSRWCDLEAAVLARHAETQRMGVALDRPMTRALVVTDAAPS